VLIVGGGAYGWGIALRLQELGAQATVIDPRPIDDADRASGGATRLLRLEYGDRGDYSELTLRARARWREIARATRADLYREVGMLFLVSDGDDGEWESASLAITRALGHGGIELEPGDIVRRWPAVRRDGIQWGIFNDMGGFLFANRATGVLASMARAAGAEYLQSRVIETSSQRVALGDGSERGADSLVLTTGAWTAGLIPGIPIRPARQVTCYLRGGPGDIPGFAEGAPFAMYGMPAHDGFGLKIGSHVTGPERDPDDPAERMATDTDLEGIAEYAARRFGVTGADAEIVRADVCFYAMTPTEDPVIDLLGDGRYVCAGFSGHGFKFAPVLSAAVAEWILGREPSVPLDRFGLTT
jgi:glycine/D-amino acid oxidase-like deaminating enzyme